MTPKISIITPSFNQGQFLEETIVSVLSQNYSNLEYIVIDGGSTDQSLDIIKKYESRLSHWESEKDRGQSHALNKGFRKATGEIVTWLNSDDTYTSGTLDKVADFFLKHPTIDLVHGKTILFGKGRKDEIRGAPEVALDALYLAYIPFPQPSSFYRRKVLDEQGLLDESLHYGMDFDLLARTALNYRISKTDEIYSRYRLHLDSKSLNTSGFINDWKIVFSRILRSIKGTEKKISELEKLGLYIAGDSGYRVSMLIENALIEESYFYFLKMQAQLYYIDGDTHTSTRLLKTIKNQNPEFYMRQELSNLYSRSRLLSPGVLKILRTIKNYRNALLFRNNSDL